MERNVPASSSTRKKRPAARDPRRHGLQPDEISRPKAKSPKGKNSKGKNPKAKGPKTKGRKDPMWARLAVIFGALFMMVGGGALAVLQVASIQLQSNIATTTGMIDPESEAFAGNSIDGAITMLMVGIDVQPSYTGPGSRGEGVLSDTIIIAHIPETHDQAYLMSIPRDTRVDIPAEPKYNYRGENNRINAAFGIGYRNAKGDEKDKRAAGVNMLSKTITSLTGIKFNGAMLIDFDGFKGVLTELGGVELCVEHRVRAIHFARDAKGNVVPTWYKDPPGQVMLPKGGSEFWYEPGCRHMNAEMALEYARLRKGDGLPNGDYDRQKNQQKLIKAMVKKAMSKGVVTDIPRLNKVIEAGGNATVMQVPGGNLLNFVFTLKDVALNDLVMIRTNAGRINSEIVNGQYQGENLSAETMKLFESVKEERLREFVLSHPEFLAPQ